jgi:hypothetical protein
MRIYIIGNDGIRPSREAPAALNEGEIAVASNEELWHLCTPWTTHSARLLAADA